MQHKESLTTWVRDNCYRTSDCSVAIVDFDVILKYLAEDILALKRMDRIFSGSKMGSAITSLFDAKRIFGSGTEDFPATPTSLCLH